MRQPGEVENNNMMPVAPLTSFENKRGILNSRSSEKGQTSLRFREANREKQDSLPNRARQMSRNLFAPMTAEYKETLGSLPENNYLANKPWDILNQEYDKTHNTNWSELNRWRTRTEIITKTHDRARLSHMSEKSQEIENARAEAFYVLKKSGVLDRISVKPGESVEHIIQRAMKEALILQRAKEKDAQHTEKRSVSKSEQRVVQSSVVEFVSEQVMPEKTRTLIEQLDQIYDTLSKVERLGPKEKFLRKMSQNYEKARKYQQIYEKKGKLPDRQWRLISHLSQFCYRNDIQFPYDLTESNRAVVLPIMEMATAANVIRSEHDLMFGHKKLSNKEYLQFVQNPDVLKFYKNTGYLKNVEYSDEFTTDLFDESKSAIFHTKLTSLMKDLAIFAYKNRDASSMDRHIAYIKFVEDHLSGKDDNDVLTMNLIQISKKAIFANKPELNKVFNLVSANVNGINSETMPNFSELEITKAREDRLASQLWMQLSNAKESNLLQRNLRIFSGQNFSVSDLFKESILLPLRFENIPEDFLTEELIKNNPIMGAIFKEHMKTQGLLNINEAIESVKNDYNSARAFFQTMFRADSFKDLANFLMGKSSGQDFAFEMAQASENPEEIKFSENNEFEDFINRISPIDLLDVDFIRNVTSVVASASLATAFIKSPAGKEILRDYVFSTIAEILPNEWGDLWENLKLDYGWSGGRNPYGAKPVRVILQDGSTRIANLNIINTQTGHIVATHSYRPEKIDDKLVFKDAIGNVIINGRVGNFWDLTVDTESLPVLYYLHKDSGYLMMPPKINGKYQPALVNENVFYDGLFKTPLSEFDGQLTVRKKTGLRMKVEKTGNYETPSPDDFLVEERSIRMTFEQTASTSVREKIVTLGGLTQDKEVDRVTGKYIVGKRNTKYIGDVNQQPENIFEDIPYSELNLIEPTTQLLVKFNRETDGSHTPVLLDKNTHWEAKPYGSNHIVIAPRELSRSLNLDYPLIPDGDSMIEDVPDGNLTSITSQINVNDCLRKNDNGYMVQPKVNFVAPNGFLYDIHEITPQNLGFQTSYNDFVGNVYSGYKCKATGYAVDPVSGLVLVGFNGGVYAKVENTNRDDLVRGEGFVIRQGDFSGYRFNPRTNEFIINNGNTEVRYTRLPNGNFVNVFDQQEVLTPQNFLLKSPKIDQNDIQRGEKGTVLLARKATVYKAKPGYPFRSLTYGTKSPFSTKLDMSKYNKEITVKDGRAKTIQKQNDKGEYQAVLTPKELKLYQRFLRQEAKEYIGKLKGLGKHGANRHNPDYAASYPANLDPNNKKTLIEEYAGDLKVQIYPNPGIYGLAATVAGLTNPRFGKDVLPILLFGHFGFLAVGAGKVAKYYRDRSESGIDPTFMEKDDYPAILDTKQWKFPIVAQVGHSIFGNNTRLGPREIPYLVAGAAYAVNGLAGGILGTQGIVNFIDDQSYVGRFVINMGERVGGNFFEPWAKDIKKQDDKDQEAKEAKRNQDAFNKIGGITTKEVAETFGAAKEIVTKLQEIDAQLLTDAMGKEDKTQDQTQRVQKSIYAEISSQYPGVENVPAQARYLFQSMLLSYTNPVVGSVTSNNTYTTKGKLSQTVLGNSQLLAQAIKDNPDILEQAFNNPTYGTLFSSPLVVQNSGGKTAKQLYENYQKKIDAYRVKQISIDDFINFFLSPKKN